jgi:hypothetical protein
VTLSKHHHHPLAGYGRQGRGRASHPTSGHPVIYDQVINCWTVSVTSESFIICMSTLLLMPLAGLHFCVGLDFVTPRYNHFKVNIIIIIIRHLLVVFNLIDIALRLASSVNIDFLFNDTYLCMEMI